MLSGSLMAAAAGFVPPVPPAGGSLFGFGPNANGATGQGTYTGNTTSPTQIGSVITWESIGCGNFFSLGIYEGKLYAWGDNSYGKTGLGTDTGNNNTPVQVGSATNWAMVSAGSTHSLAIKTDGTLWSWGENANGKTGLGTTTGNTTSPTQIGSDTDWAAVSAGRYHSLVLKTNGTLYSFGSNSRGATGQGTTSGNTTTPTQVGSDTNWDMISGGDSWSLLKKTTGTLWSCGTNANGRTAQGTTTGNTTSPTQIGSDTDWAAVSAGWYHGLAIKTTGTLWSWGENANGKTGRGTTVGNTTTPTQVGSDTNWAMVSAKVLHTLLIKNTGTLWSCGSNTDGVTGLGTGTGDTTSPTQVGSDTDWAMVSAGNGHSLTRK